MMAAEGTGVDSVCKQFGEFVFPQIHDNLDGWGPCEVPEQFRDTPYQPFSKDDRLGKVLKLLSASLTNSRVGSSVCVSAEGPRLDKNLQGFIEGVPRNLLHILVC